jgi:hypothetical protein
MEKQYQIQIAILKKNLLFLEDATYGILGK